MDYTATLTAALKADGWHVAPSADTAKVLPAAVILPPTTAARSAYGSLWTLELPVQFAVPSPVDLAHGIADLLARVNAFADAIESTGAALAGIDTFGAVTVGRQAGVAGTARLALDLTP